MRRFLPFIIFVSLIGLFIFGLSRQNSVEVRSVLIGKPAPSFALLPLQAGGHGLTNADLSNHDVSGGKPVLINFFASWCVPCRAEHENLMILAREKGIVIYGISYRDRPRDSLAFLDELGNPFTRMVIDGQGRTAIDWGVSGVPETFLVDADGIIRYRHWGPVVGDSLEKRLWPEIEAVLAEKRP